MLNKTHSKSVKVKADSVPVPETYVSHH